MKKLYLESVRKVSLVTNPETTVATEVPKSNLASLVYKPQFLDVCLLPINATYGVIFSKSEKNVFWSIDSFFQVPQYDRSILHIIIEVFSSSRVQQSKYSTLSIKISKYHTTTPMSMSFRTFLIVIITASTNVRTLL